MKYIENKYYFPSQGAWSFAFLSLFCHVLFIILYTLYVYFAFSKTVSNDAHVKQIMVMTTFPTIIAFSQLTDYSAQFLPIGDNS